MTATSVKKVNGHAAASPEPRFDPVALAEAEAIRTRAAAEADALRKKAEGEAKAAEILAAEQAEALRLENEKQQLTLNRNQLRFQREEAEQRTKIEKAEKEREDIARARANEQRAEQEQQQSEAQAAAEVKDADDKWRSYAIRFAVVCGIVSLPVQMSFFWNPRAPWMAAAPIMLEGAAWVVHRGARAAAVSKRPVWHYRTIVWLLAFLAAGVNLYHGLHSFDPGTAVATAFASIAGPGVWDLHENGRIRKRDGVLTRRERRAAEKAAKEMARQRAAEEERKRAEKKAADEAAEKARQELRETRQTVFKDVWEEAVKIGAALGKEPDDPAVWPRAYRNIKGCEPGESIESISSRRAAERRVESALSGTPVNTLSKTKNAQRAAQMPTGPNRVLKARATRRPGDTPKYADAARKQAAITARQAAKNDRPNDN
ncbi:hypothetical protein [Streptomyces sp. NPDC086519]|uniref:hypothetical protein n=1 Tax=Streptomyces sp. NPDC086519 TaxID=3154863 RepID=UPI00341D6F14